jgi:hypothetical protein
MQFACNNMACLSLLQLSVSIQSETAEDSFPEDIRAYTVNDTDSNANRFIDQAQEEVRGASNK